MEEKNVSMWGGIAGAVASITNTVITTSPKVRENQLAIAEANARAAEANGNAVGATGSLDPKMIVVIAVVIVAIILIVMFTKKQA